MSDRDRSEVDDRSAKDKEQRNRDESEAERLDRNYDELLQELRVLQAGMQILFAFLLSLAFQSRFTAVSQFDRDVYVATLIVAALATGCLLAPVVFHRIVFRRGMKDDLMRAATRYVAAGLTLLFLAMHGAVLLVLDFLVGRTFAVTAVAIIGAIVIVLWVVVPLVARAHETDDEQDSP